MNLVRKLRYLGPRQVTHKLSLKLEHAIKAQLLPVPQLPAPAALLDQTLTLLGHRYDLRQPQRWHLSPDTGKCWAFQYSPTIALTRPEAAGDMKLIREINRHQFLPALAAAQP